MECVAVPEGRDGEAVDVVVRVPQDFVSFLKEASQGKDISTPGRATRKPGGAEIRTSNAERLPHTEAASSLFQRSAVEMDFKTRAGKAKLREACRRNG